MTKKTTFTAAQLEAALNKLQSVDRDFPEYPLLFNVGYDSGVWSEESYPLMFRKIGTDQEVLVSCKEFHVGAGEGDNSLYMVLSVGYGDAIRYFMKSGFYDSWDNGNDDFQWDGGLNEVESKQVTKTEWVSK